MKTKLNIYHSYVSYNLTGTFTAVPSERDFYKDDEIYVLVGECEVEPLPESFLRQLGAKELDKKITAKYFEIKQLEEMKQQLLCL